MIALLVALLAILYQPVLPPADFAAGAIIGSEHVVTTEFIGTRWLCFPDDDELCYAGLDLTTGQFVTGP